jgi:hypothetical protein
VPRQEEKKQKLAVTTEKQCNKPRHESKYNRPIPPDLKLIELSAAPSLNLQTDQNIRRVHGEIRLGNHRTSNVHEGVQQGTEGRRSLLEGYYECRALKVLISKIQERNNAEEQ